MWRRPSSSAVQTSSRGVDDGAVGQVLGGRARRSRRRRSPRAAPRAASGGSVVSWLPARSRCARSAHSPSAISAGDGAARPDAAVGGDAVDVDVVAGLHAALEQQRLRGVRQERSPVPSRRPACRGRGSRPCRSGSFDRLGRAVVPVRHAAHLLERVEEGHVVVRADLVALAHDAVGRGVHRAGVARGRGDVGVLGLLARRVGAAARVLVVEAEHVPRLVRGDGLRVARADVIVPASPSPSSTIVTREASTLPPCLRWSTTASKRSLRCGGVLALDLHGQVRRSRSSSRAPRWASPSRGATRVPTERGVSRPLPAWNWTTCAPAAGPCAGPTSSDVMFMMLSNADPVVPPARLTSASPPTKPFATL